ncbi:hypothetical protein ACU8WE_28475 [Pseudomonas parakoreensis]
MNYLEKEIDSTLAEQSLAHEKLCDDELSKLITRLTTLFFFPETKGLDPYHLKNTQKKTRSRILEKSRQAPKF